MPIAHALVEVLQEVALDDKVLACEDISRRPESRGDGTLANIRALPIDCLLSIYHVINHSSLIFILPELDTRLVQKSVLPVFDSAMLVLGIMFGRETVQGQGIVSQTHLHENFGLAQLVINAQQALIGHQKVSSVQFFPQDSLQKS